MACFLVTVAEAAAVTVAAKIIAKKEKSAKELKVSLGGEGIATSDKIPFSRKLKWLSNLQWGGSLLLAFEHIWHGEIIPKFPFLTAMSNAADTKVMIREMATVGVGMAVITTAVWLGMLSVCAVMEKRTIKENKTISVSE